MSAAEIHLCFLYVRTVFAVVRDVWVVVARRFPRNLWCSSVVVALGNSSRSDHLFCHWMTRRWFCEAGSGVVFSAIVDHFIEWSILWVHTGTCAALNKACVAQCRHVGPFRDLMFGSRYLVPVFLHFSFAQRVAAEAGFSHLLLAFSGCYQCHCCSASGVWCCEPSLLVSKKKMQHV